MSDEAPALSLLPPNRSLLEAGLDLAFAKLLERIEPPFPALMDPAASPLDFLPYLAADRGVSEWNALSSEAEKRATVASAWGTKRQAGTRRALEQAVLSLQMKPTVRAWYEKAPAGAPYSFEVTAWVSQSYDADVAARLELRLSDAKSERDRLAVVIGLEGHGSAYIGAAVTDGEILTVYPYAPGPIEVSSPAVLVGGALHEIDYLSVYP